MPCLPEERNSSIKRSFFSFMVYPIVFYKGKQKLAHIMVHVQISLLYYLEMMVIGINQIRFQVVFHFSIPLMVAYDGFFLKISTSLKPVCSSISFNCSGG